MANPCPHEGCSNELGFECLAIDCPSKPPTEAVVIKAKVAALEARMATAEAKLPAR